MTKLAEAAPGTAARGATLDSRLLRHFLAVVQAGNMTAAAVSLGLTQPALSKSIQHLEQELGVELFNRHAGGVTPTTYGEALARRARLIDTELRSARAEIDAIRRGGAVTIRIGASPVWTTLGLPRVVAGLHRELPQTKLRITSGVIDTLVPALQAGELDLICAALDFPDHPDIVKEFFFEAEHAVVVHRSHPLAGAREVSAADLLRHPWATVSHDNVGMARLGSYFSAGGHDQPRILAEVQPFEALIAILQLGEYISTIAAPMLGFAEQFGIVKLPIRGTLWRFRAGIAYRQSAPSNPALGVLISHLRARAGEIMPATHPG